MIRTAAGGSAKASIARSVARQPHQGGGFTGFDPIGIFILRRVEIMIDQDKRFGIAGPNPDDGPR